jgi:excisionase family DNA binding protein
MFTLKATYPGPPDLTINFLYSETPKQKDYIVVVRKIESAQRLMKVGYVLLEDTKGEIDKGKMPLSPKQAAGVLGTAQSTVYKYINNGRLAAEKVGDGWRISRAAVETLRAELAG